MFRNHDARLASGDKIKDVVADSHISRSEDKYTMTDPVVILPLSILSPTKIAFEVS